MKRKDWKEQNLKKGFYDNKKVLFNFKLKYKYRRYVNYFRKRNDLVLTIVQRRVKKLLKRYYHFNYIFYKSLIKNKKYIRQNYFYNLYFDYKKSNYLKYFPQFSSVKNILNKKNNGIELLRKNQVNLMFFSNKYNKNSFGLSYYVINCKFSDSLIVNNLNKDLENEDFFNLIQKKYFFNKNTLSILNEFNLFFNFNICLLNSLEIYKIILILYINKLI